MNENELKTADTPESSTSATDSSPQKNWLWAIVAAVVALVLVVLVLVSYMLVYRSSGTSAYEDWVIKTFNLPVAKVNGKKLLLEDYNKNVTASEYFFDKQDAASLGLAQELTGEEIREQELESMINRALLEEVARDRGVEVTDEDVDTYFNDVVIPQAAGGLEEVETTLSELYNWTVDDFKQAVLRDVVLQSAIQEDIAADEQLAEELRNEAVALREEIINDAENGFDYYAQQYSDDPGSALNGGSLGSFGRGVMVAEFEEAAFNLTEDTVSEPVKTVFGYHLITVTSRDSEADTIEASHILLAFPTLDELLEEKREQAEIKEYVPVYEEEKQEDAATEETTQGDDTADITAEEGTGPTTDESATTEETTDEVEEGSNE